MSKPKISDAHATTAFDSAAYARAAVDYTQAEQAIISQLEAAVGERLAKKPKRLLHSRSVASTAEAMAVRYRIDPWEARVAGLLHDWDKALAPDEQLRKARVQGIDLGVPLELVLPLLHGMTAAADLAQRYPELPPSVLQAISRHTLGAADMTALDMVIFTADIVEPYRPPSTAVEHTRAMIVASKPLDDVYWSAFTRGIIYVIETGRYLFPGTLDIYNELVLQHARTSCRKRKD